MKKALTAALILAALFVDAGDKKEHRHHTAHVHGGATLNIAFDHLKGKIEFNAAAEGILGFEHQARTKQDQSKLTETLAKFEQAIGSMIKFEDSVDCLFTKEKIEVTGEKEVTIEKETPHENRKDHNTHKGEHSDFFATFFVDCKKELNGTKVTFDLSQFKGLKDLDVTLLVGDLQKSVEVRSQPVTVELK